MIPREHLAHLQRRVSIIVAGRDAQLQPHLVRALGCRVQRQPLRVTVLVAADMAGEVLDDLRANDQVAVVFSEPSTHRTVQLKGGQISIEAGSAADRELARDYTGRFVAEVAMLGYAEPLIANLVNHEPGQLLAVSFTPTASFDQTPGARPAPEAGVSG
jgi:hypothetical protein